MRVCVCVNSMCVCCVNSVFKGDLTNTKRQQLSLTEFGGLSVGQLTTDIDQ